MTTILSVTDWRTDDLPLQTALYIAWHSKKGAPFMYLLSSDRFLSHDILILSLSLYILYSESPRDTSNSVIDVDYIQLESIYDCWT